MRRSTAVTDLVLLDAASLARVIAERAASCVEVMQAYLDHIERLNPEVNAIVALGDRASLLAKARAADDVIPSGLPLGALHGFPMAVKDLVAVQGMVMSQGSPIFRDFVPAADDLAVERLRAAGAIVIGKTNVPEFGLGSHTYNKVYGPTLNAWDQSRSAGGSSGGAAVALALRMAPVADGSDYGGSLRNPAGWNNVYGFRTSIGRVPTSVGDPWIPSMGVQGPMARTVADLARLLEVQAGFDARQPLSIETPKAAFTGRLERDFKGVRLGWLGDFGGQASCEPEVLAVCGRALKAFAEIGCEVEEVLPDHPIEEAWNAFKRIRHWHAGGRLRALYDDPARRPHMKPEAIFEVEMGAKLSAYDVTAAQAIRAEWCAAVRSLFERCDFLLAPTAQVFPFDVSLDWPKAIAGKAMATYHEWMKGVCLVSMTGCPSLGAPAGFSDGGLPIGLQIIGPAHADLACLQLAAAYESATNWATRRLPPLLTTR